MEIKVRDDRLSMNLGRPPGRQIDVTIDEPFQDEVPEAWLRTVVQSALSAALPEGESCQVGLVVTGDETVHELNREFRGLDEVTDVLSFSASHPARWEGESAAPEDRYAKSGDPVEAPFVLPAGQPPPLGEVIISYPQARRQAAEHGAGVQQELALLVVHGVLHLMGHDHLEPEQAAQMRAGEQAALKSVLQVRTPDR